MDDAVAEPSKKTKHNDVLLRTLDGGKRSITVHDVGEISRYPDVIKFTVSVCSCKDSIESVKGSVKRRVDYTLQTLRSHGIGEKSITVSTDINRGEGYEMRSDVLVQHNNAQQCQSARNFLVEKLDSSVVISPISCHCSSAIKEQLRFVYVCPCVYLYILFACMYVYVYVHRYLTVQLNIYGVCVCACMHVCVYVSVYMYMQCNKKNSYTYFPWPHNSMP